MQMPEISIIVPVYNAEKYLAQCMDSIINQTFKNIEIICVNDGSTDNSLEILQSYQNNDNRIFVINQANTGVSMARNNAIKKSSAPYIMFVDSDDSLCLNACERAYDAMRSSNADTVLYSCELRYNGVSAPKYAFGEEQRLFDKNQVRNVLYRRCFGLLNTEMNILEQQDYLSACWLKLYSAEIIKSNNLSFVDIKEIGSYEDGLFNLKYFSYSCSAVYIPDVLYYYRRDNDDSNTSKYKSDLYFQWQRLFMLMQNEIDNNNLSANFREALNNRQALSIIGLGINIAQSDFGFFYKKSLIKEILSDKEYFMHVSKLETKLMRFHWKVFFLCCKLKLSLFVTLLLIIMNSLRRKV